MSTIAIGDIHGNLSALVDLLNQIRRECGRTDTVVFLGDYIDRGPDSKGCVDAILEFRTEVPAEVLCLLGNHEDWMLRSMRDHRSHSWLLGMGALTTIDSYSTDAALTIGEAVARLGANVYLERETLPYEVFFDSMPEDHRRFFESLGLFHQTPDCACTHGGLDPSVARIEDQRRNDFIWGAGDFPDGYKGDTILVYGHRNNAAFTDDRQPTPRVVGRTIGIDTISHGVLTAIRLPDQRIFQSARYELFSSGA
jgi:serine/threonine protein phosphatase 1